MLTGVRVTNVGSAARAARRLASCGVRLVTVKLPDGGCVLWDGSEAVYIPTAGVDAVDATGAGDAFTGSLALPRTTPSAPHGQKPPFAARIEAAPRYGLYYTAARGLAELNSRPLGRSSIQRRREQVRSCPLQSSGDQTD